MLLRGSPQGATGYLQAGLRDPELIPDRAAGAGFRGPAAAGSTLALRESCPQDPDVFLSPPRGAVCA